MASRPALTWQIDGKYEPRLQFHNQGVLTNTSSTSFGPIAPNLVLFGISVDLGKIQNTSSPLTWAFGVVRNPSIGYSSADNTTQDLSPYYVTRYPGSSGLAQAIDNFTAGFSEAQKRAIALDNAILENASNISTQYADLVSLAARQTLGSLDFTVSTGTDGKPNASDVRIFMKDMASSTTTGRVSPVEKIYGALPLLLYLNASIVGPLLAPLLDAQYSTVGKLSAAQDLGPAYPNATGATWGPNLDVEQSGNMLIMLYAHTQFSGDGSLIYRYYDLAKRWADYLINNTFNSTSEQFSADSFEIGSTANITNLALKGIIGVKSMAEISRAVGEQADAKLYDEHAATLATSWHSLTLSSDGSHLLGSYGDEGSWALMYNIYADRLLGTGVVNETILRSQTAFYKALRSSSALNFGLPIHGNTSLTNAAWVLFTAAIVTDDGLRDNLIRSVWDRASFNQTQGPFPELYYTRNGSVSSGSALTNASPSFGAMFSLLALSVPDLTINVSPPQLGGGPAGGQSKQGARHGASIGEIVGSVVGSIAVALLLGAVVYYAQRRRRNRSLEMYGHRLSMGSLFSGTQSPTGDVPTSGFSASPSAFVHGSVSGAATIATKSFGAPESPVDAIPSPPSPTGHARMNSYPQTAPQDAPSSNTSSAARNGSSGYSDEIIGLRVEMENLRRAVQEIHIQVGRGTEAPPEYVE
ncbi:uncharacterized protein TRAVEDRAFT_69088 [Trametes versicolor FP-101664 SS1]|uniref:uncharacterized protein n=1 Tax=Trametes versicolor (strain FP-101664) TaxID=717944 RepID=UPI00046213EF|nr:uncharacterized protein TRAVEDRAFT_69088 [Trametes versicolor FP-101664 SS1]EIW62865.1 hypothetical protein TRAVEDRAFT_69088 [Trametes versicolor FP-101664 SS1]